MTFVYSTLHWSPSDIILPCDGSSPSFCQGHFEEFYSWLPSYQQPCPTVTVDEQISTAALQVTEDNRKSHNANPMGPHLESIPQSCQGATSDSSPEKLISNDLCYSNSQKRKPTSLERRMPSWKSVETEQVTSGCHVYSMSTGESISAGQRSSLLLATSPR